MIYQATQTIYDSFQERDYRCSIEEYSASSAVRVGLSCDNCSFEALYISRDDDNDVSMRIFELLKFPEARTDDVIRIANDANYNFRFLKFCVDVDSHVVHVEFDFPINTGDPGETAYEMLQRAGDIVDEMYPKFMRCIYGGGSASDGEDAT